MLNDVIHILGAALVLFGFATWLVGARAVKRRHLRRMGEESLLFDPSQWSTKDFDESERRARLRYFLLSLLLAGVGSGLVRHAWS